MAKLLMLDDDENALTWMRAALESRGHELAVFTRARDALAALETFEPDIVVADVMMPELDGLSFARLVQRNRKIPLIFVSIAKKQAEAVLAGAVGFVTKPASAAEIRAAVDRILGEGARQSVVLVVDDDPSILDLYKAFLEPRFLVRTAQNGRDGLAVLERERVDLAIVDVLMPVMNGVELVRAIRENPELEKLPVIVQTSDRNAQRAQVWAPLRVSQVMDKAAFLDWFESQMRAVG